MICLVVALHLILAGLLLAYPTQAPVTPEWTLHQLTDLVGHLPVVVGLVLASVAALHGRRRHQWGWLIPQQLVFGCSVADILRAIWRGQYPDNYIPQGNPHVFIFCDQLYGLLFIWAYTWAMADFLRRYPIRGATP